MWPESSSVNTVNLARKFTTIPEISNFSQGFTFFWRGTSGRKRKKFFQGLQRMWLHVTQCKICYSTFGFGTMKGQSCQNLTKCGFCRRVYLRCWQSWSYEIFTRHRGSDSADHLRPSCLNEHSLLPNCFTPCFHCISVFHCTVFMFYCM